MVKKKMTGKGEGTEDNITCLGYRRKLKTDEGRGSDRREK